MLGGIDSATADMGAVDEALRGRDAGRNGLLGKYYLEYSTFR